MNVVTSACFYNFVSTSAFETNFWLKSIVAKILAKKRNLEKDKAFYFKVNR